MRLLVTLAVLLLMVLMISDGVSAKKSGREQPGKKKRSSGLEETNYGEKDGSVAEHNNKQHVKYHDNSRNRKRRSVDETYFGRSNSDDTSNDGRSEDCPENLKKSSSRGKRENGRTEDKNLRRKENTLKSVQGDKPKRKSDSHTQKKSRQSDNEAKNRQHFSEESSNSADDNDATPNHEKSAKDSCDSIDCSDDVISKSSFSQSRSKKEHSKRKNSSGKKRESNTEEEESDEEMEAEFQVSDEPKRMKVKSEKSVCKKNDRCNNEEGRQERTKKCDKDEEKANRKWEKRSGCTIKHKHKNSSEKSSIKCKNDVSTLDDSIRKNKESLDIVETPEDEENEEEDENPHQEDAPEID